MSGDYKVRDMRKCRICKKDIEDTNNNPYCTECFREHCRKQAARKEVLPISIKALWENARDRAKKKGTEFTIKPDDIPYTDTCPIFGFKFERHGGRLNNKAPSLDRVDNSKGYIPGNVQIISHKANSLKGTLSFKEIEKLYNYMKGL